MLNKKGRILCTLLMNTNQIHRWQKYRRSLLKSKYKYQENAPVKVEVLKQRFYSSKSEKLQR